MFPAGQGCRSFPFSSARPVGCLLGHLPFSSARSVGCLLGHFPFSSARPVGCLLGHVQGTRVPTRLVFHAAPRCAQSRRTGGRNGSVVRGSLLLLAAASKIDVIATYVPQCRLRPVASVESQKQCCSLWTGQGWGRQPWGWAPHGLASPDTSVLPTASLLREREKEEKTWRRAGGRRFHGDLPLGREWRVVAVRRKVNLAFFLAPSPSQLFSAF